MPGGIQIDDSGEPIRQAGIPGGFNGPGGGGGPPPGGGPGGGFGGAGSGFGAAGPSHGLNGLVAALMKRKGMLGAAPLSAPGPTDTQPAMLTPGEIVMNNGVTQNPQMAQMLLLMNMMGAGGVGTAPRGYSWGGMVPGYAFGRGVPGYGCGGMVPRVPGYAAGGLVGQVNPGMFQQNRWTNLGQQQSLGNMGQMRPPTNVPGYNPGGMNPGAQWGQGGNGFNYTYDKSGYTQNFDPKDPWGSLTQNRGADAFGGASRTLGGFGQAGYFDPNGNQALINSASDAALRQQRSQEAASGVNAQLAGLDPSAAASYKLEAGMRAGSDRANAVANARLQALGSQNQFAQDMYRQLAAAYAGMHSQNLQGNIQNNLQQNAQNNANRNWWQPIVGQVGGGVLGGLLGGLGGGGGGGIPQTDIAPYNPDWQGMHP